jgi:hypothetical protein
VDEQRAERRGLVVLRDVAERGVVLRERGDLSAEALFDEELVAPALDGLSHADEPTVQRARGRALVLGGSLERRDRLLQRHHEIGALLRFALKIGLEAQVSHVRGGDRVAFLAVGACLDARVQRRDDLSPLALPALVGRHSCPPPGSAFSARPGR